LLLIERQAFAFLLISALALLQQVVIEPTALFKRLVELLDLFLGWRESVLKQFTHLFMLAQKWQEVKREAAPLLPQLRKSPFLPRINDRGGKALLGVKQQVSLGS
jgi:hypothetical protein